MTLFMQISSFKGILASRSSVAKHIAQRSLLLTPQSQALARHLLAEVVEYVRYCRESDDDSLMPREQRTLDNLRTLAATTPTLSEPTQNPAYAKALHAGLRTARTLIKGHDLWLGHNDPERRAILATFGELGFYIKDRSLENDPDPDPPADL